MKSNSGLAESEGHFQNEGECEVRAWNESCAAAARHENFCIIHASPRESERHWPMLGVGQFTSQRLCQTSHIAPKSKQMTSSIHLAKQPSTGDSKLHVEHQCYASHAKTIFTSDPKPRAFSCESTMEASHRCTNRHIVHLWHTGSFKAQLSW